MNATKQYFLLALLLGMALFSQARSRAKCDTGYYSIGKQAMAINFKHLINYKCREASFSDFKGKPVILDFWATWCQPCVAMLPKMVSIQKQFGNALQIILVNQETEERAEAFFSRMQKISPIDLPCELKNTDLFKSFGVQSVPNYVWINKEGIICAVTDHEALTTENISSFIKNDKINIETKPNVAEQPYDYNLPLLSGNNGDVNILQYHSIITGYYSGQVTRYSTPMSKSRYKGRRVMACNCPVDLLYRIAYSSPEYPYGFPSSRTIYQIKDTTVYKINPDWKDTTDLYCYELIVPERKATHIYEIMRQDMERYFGFYGTVVSKPTKCYVLINQNAKSSEGNPQFEMSNYWIKMKNSPISRVMDALEHYNQMDIFINETHLDHPIDLDIEGDLRDIEVLKKGFAKYGLELVEEQRPQDYLILTDNPSSNGR